MKMTDYAKVRKGSSHVMEDMLLKNWEKRLICKMCRVELVGKRGRTVPLMMTDLMKKSVNTIVASRVGIPDSNPYLFAVPGTESHFRGCDALRELSRHCGAQKPELLRSTQLRKHIATITQIMNLQENDLDILSKYLGHDIRVHREFYRLPDPTIQVAKLSKMLLALEGDKPAESLRGKRLKDVEVDQDEGSDNVALNIKKYFLSNIQRVPEKRETGFHGRNFLS